MLGMDSEEKAFGGLSALQTVGSEVPSHITRSLDGAVTVPLRGQHLEPFLVVTMQEGGTTGVKTRDAAK